MQTIEGVKKGLRVAVAVAAVFAAVWCSAATGMSPPRAGKADVVKELFPWFEIGEVVDVAKVKGLKLPWMAGALDYLRQPRVTGAPDMGCYENDPPGLLLMLK